MSESLPSSYTSSAKVTRFSDIRRAGDHPGTIDPGGATLPPGGVMPPLPEKYGTFAARWFPSNRNVTNWLGMTSKVTDASHALYESPAFSVKYGVPAIAVAPLIGGSSTR